MKKLISFSMFALLMLLLVWGQSARAAETHTRYAPRPRIQVWVAPYWKWNPRLRQYVWVPGRYVVRPAPVVRIRRVR